MRRRRSSSNPLIDAARKLAARDRHHRKEI
jgi:hypothetical protein